MNTTMVSGLARFAVALIAGALATACGPPQVDSKDRAHIAYLGLDPVVSNALELGFDGFNAASDANIPAQSAAGSLSGTLDVSGHVDRGASTNRTMNLTVALADYCDGTVDDPATTTIEKLKIAYATSAAAPLTLAMDLKGIPTGTFSGQLTGEVSMSGDLTGSVTLDVSVTGALAASTTSAGQTVRVVGETHVTGTAKSADGTFAIDTTL